jgi:hypothetical protein
VVLLCFRHCILNSLSRFYMCRQSAVLLIGGAVFCFTTRLRDDVIDVSQDTFSHFRVQRRVNVVSQRQSAQPSTGPHDICEGNLGTTIMTPKLLRMYWGPCLPWPNLLFSSSLPHRATKANSLDVGIDRTMAPC